MAKKEKYKNYDVNNINRNNKVKIKTIAEKINVDIDEVLSCAINMGCRVYNLPPKGAKKPRYFVSQSNAQRIKKQLIKQDK